MDVQKGGCDYDVAHRHHGFVENAEGEWEYSNYKIDKYLHLIEEDTEALGAQMAAYQDFVQKAFFCVKRISQTGEEWGVCIHKETGEVKNKRLFLSAPERITSYAQLKEGFGAFEKAAFPDLDRENWQEYFAFMLLPPLQDGEVLKKQLLSADLSILRRAAQAVIALVLKRKEERKQMLRACYGARELIRKNLACFDFSGIFGNLNYFIAVGKVAENEFCARVNCIQVSCNK